MTRRFAVLGDPVAHSRSPAIHTAAFKALDLDADYQSRQVDGAGLREAMDAIRSGELVGANVTMPHKGAAAALADRLDGVAARLGAVNTLVWDRGDVVGYSTDGAGVLHAWAVGGLPTDAPVLVLGAGGAAKAAVDVLARRNEVVVSARRLEAAVDLVHLGARHTVPWGSGVPGAVVVNATPIGMDGRPLPDGVLGVASGFLEMVYAPESTPSVDRARAMGLPVGWGIDMLVGQAAASFSLWFGVEPPIDVMTAAAKRSSTP